MSAEQPRGHAPGAEPGVHGARAGTDPAAAGAEPGATDPAAAGPEPGTTDRAAVGARRFALLVNPASAGGRALKALPRVHEVLDELRATHRTVTTRSIDHAYQEAVGAAAGGETIVALGGDGLLRPIAGALKGTGSPLAIVPCGRGNDLARMLGVPTDPGAAARVAVQGRERLIDVANVEGTPYMGVASFGFDSDANRIANEAKLVKGDAVYVYAALRALATWKGARFRVLVDGVLHEFTGCTVAVGNSKVYGGGMYVLPEAEIDDGRLDVMFVKDASRLRLLALLPRVFKGTHGSSELVEFHRGEEIEVSSDRPFAIYADGDPIGATPAIMRVERRCLRVIAPA